MTLLGNLWSPMRSSAPAHNNLLVRRVVPMLSHSVRWRASLYEKMRLFGDLHQAPMIRSKVLWCVVRSLATSDGPPGYVSLLQENKDA